jgi:FkbM family methyltransferase
MSIIASRVRHGVLCHFDGDRPIGMSLRTYGEWAEEEVYLLSLFIRRGAVVVDVGSNIGTHALAFSRFVSREGRVIAVEAQEAIFNLLVMNMLINDARHVNCIHAIVSRDSTLCYLPATETPSQSAAVSFCNVNDNPSPGTGSGAVLPLPVINLDSLALDRCDLIKIDVEGMEFDVLRGAENTIHDYRPPVYFEPRRRNFANVFSFFTEADYTLFWHAASPFNIRNWHNNPHNVFGGTRELNILALPTEKKLQWKAQSGDLKVIETPEYSPPPFDSTPGWTLPASAYADLPSVTRSLVSSLARVL